MGFLREYNGRTSLYIVGIDEKKVARLDVGEAMLANDAPKEVASFNWISNDRLVIVTTVWDMFYGVIASIGTEARLSRSPATRTTRSASTMQAAGPRGHSRLRRQGEEHPDAGPARGCGGSANRPDILRIDTLTGAVSRSSKPRRGCRLGPGLRRVPGWRDTHGQQSGAIYRESVTAPWRTIMPLENRRGGLRPLGFDAGGQRMLVGALNAEKRWAVFPLDPATGVMGNPVLSDPVYDIVSEAPGGGPGSSW